MKKYDIFLGRCDGWHTTRVAHNVNSNVINDWIAKGYRVATEHQIGTVLHEIYLVKAA